MADRGRDERDDCTTFGQADGAISRLAGRQRALITRAQLRELGIGSRAIDYAIARGRLNTVHHGIYSLVPFAALPDVGPRACRGPRLRRRRAPQPPLRRGHVGHTSCFQWRRPRDRDRQGDRPATPRHQGPPGQRARSPRHPPLPGDPDHLSGPRAAGDRPRPIGPTARARARRGADQAPDHPRRDRGRGRTPTRTAAASPASEPQPTPAAPPPKRAPTAKKRCSR